MKNKKKLYLLLISTIFVWGFLIYKVFFSNDDASSATLSETRRPLTSSEVSKSKSESLILDYIDPFLKTKVESNRVIKLKPQNNPSVKQRKVSWPKIKYTGMIQNMLTNEIRANISINNKNYILKENEIRSEITVKEIHSDFIILSKNNVLKTINKPK